MSYITAGSLCPRCHAKLMLGQIVMVGAMKEISIHKDFSAGKAIAGAFLAGPIGVAAGALGGKKKAYECMTCGFTCDANGNEIR